MNDNLPPPNFGAAPVASSLGRLKPYFTGMVAGGALAAAAVYLGTVALPDRFRPGSVAGDIAADTLTHEIRGSIDATVDKIHRESLASAEVQVRASTATALNQAAIAERTQALAPLDSIATGAEVVCMGARSLVQNGGRDWQSVGNFLAQVTCGVSESVRPAVLASQIEAAHTASIASGMPLTGGPVSAHATPRDPPSPAIRPVASPQPPAIPAPATPLQAGRATVTPVQAVTTAKAKVTPIEVMQAMTLRQASQHYTPAQVKVAEAVADMLPPQIRSHMRDGLAPGEDDVFVERVSALMKLAERMQ